MTADLDLAAIREQVADAEAIRWAWTTEQFGRWLAAITVALCDALDAARATIAAQAAEVERLRAQVETQYARVHEWRMRAWEATDLAADALRLGLEECERLRAALAEADAAWSIANTALDGIEDAFPVVPPTGGLGQREVWEFSDAVRDVLYALSCAIGHDHATTGDAVRAVRALRADRDALRDEVAGLRAMVEGRGTPTLTKGDDL